MFPLAFSRSLSQASAVCAYSVSAIRNIFNEGKFKTPVAVETSHVKWVMYTGELPVPRPGAVSLKPLLQPEVKLDIKTLGANLENPQFSAEVLCCSASIMWLVKWEWIAPWTCLTKPSSSSETAPLWTRLFTLRQEGRCLLRRDLCWLGLWWTVCRRWTERDMLSCSSALVNYSISVTVQVQFHSDWSKADLTLGAVIISLKLQCVSFAWK